MGGALPAFGDGRAQSAVSTVWIFTRNDGLAGGQCSRFGYSGRGLAVEIDPSRGELSSPQLWDVVR